MNHFKVLFDFPFDYKLNYDVIKITAVVSILNNLNEFLNK